MTILTGHVQFEVMEVPPIFLGDALVTSGAINRFCLILATEVQFETTYALMAASAA